MKITLRKFAFRRADRLWRLCSRSWRAAKGRFDPCATRSVYDRSLRDIVEKLEFLRRSQFRGPPEASTEYSLGVRLSDRSCHVRRSNKRCCGNYRCRQHYMRSSEIFAAPQFPSFSTVSTSSGHCRSRCKCRNWADCGRPPKVRFRMDISLRRTELGLPYAACNRPNQGSQALERAHHCIASAECASPPKAECTRSCIGGRASRREPIPRDDRERDSLRTTCRARARLCATSVRSK